jgi:hypothetical protein
MPLSTIEEDPDFVAIPVEQAAPLIADRTSIDSEWDPERNDRYAGLKHACMCAVSIGSLIYVAILFSKIYHN